MTDTKSKTNFIFIVIMMFIFVIALVLRTVVFLDNRPLWHDEAPVALTVMNNGFLSIFGNIIDNQKAPPAFWIITKFFAQFANYNELSLRFFPFVCSIISVFVFYIFSKSFLDNKFALILANFLFAINQKLLYFSQELKQYSCDVLFFCISVMFFSKMLKVKLDRKNLIICVAISMFLLFFSLPCFFTIAAFFLYKIFLLDKKEIKYYMALCIILIFFSLIYYKIFFFKAYTEEMLYLSEYWEEGFININNIADISKSLFLYFFYPNAAYIFGALLFLSGCYYLFSEKPIKISSKVMLFSLLFIIAASILRLYPLYGRVAVYLIPAAVIIMVKPLDVSIVKSKRFLISFSLLLLTIPMYLHSDYYTNFFKKDIFTSYDGKETLMYIKNNYGGNEKVLINKGSSLMFEYYAKQLNFNISNIEIFDYSKRDEKEFFDYLNSMSKNKTFWIYYAYTGNMKKEVFLLNRWRDENIQKVKEEYIKNKSFVLKI